MSRFKSRQREIWGRSSHAFWRVSRRQISRNKAPLVMVADAHARARLLLESLLVGHDCRVICAEDSHETLRLLQRFHFDLIIYDVGLPGLGGVTLLRYVKLHTPDTEVLLVTERAEPGLTSLAIQHGALDCLVKPLGRGAVDTLIFHVRKAAGKGPGPNN